MPVRLGFTADARPDQVTANAAIVQRRGDDGEWVGESGDYRFAVVPENAEEGEEPDRADETGAAPSPLPEGEELAGTGTRRGHAHLLPLATAATGCLTLGAGALLLAARARRRP
ncbi:hypothetical protein GCM10023237_70240 [Streptomyces coeruleoprunus]|uniref:hypothetical protein n=1 Tax=Streptomyces coeruleoprunus TaxID=285563 RepID=UPI0031EF9272